MVSSICLLILVMLLLSIFVLACFPHVVQGVVHSLRIIAARGRQRVCIVHDWSCNAAQTLPALRYAVFLRRQGFKNVTCIDADDPTAACGADIVVMWLWSTQINSRDFTKMRHAVVSAAPAAKQLLLSESQVYSTLKIDGVSIINDIAKLRPCIDGIIEMQLM